MPYQLQFWPVLVEVAVLERLDDAGTLVVDERTLLIATELLVAAEVVVPPITP